MKPRVSSSTRKVFTVGQDLLSVFPGRVQLKPPELFRERRKYGIWRYLAKGVPHGFTTTYHSLASHYSLLSD